MCEAWWNPKHPAVLGRKGNTSPLSELGRVTPDIDSHIEDFAMQNADELTLSLLDLIVKPSENSAPGTGMIVLHKTMVYPEVLECTLVVALEEKSSLVAEDLRF